MSIITKTLAEQIAIRLTAPNADKLATKRKELKEWVTDIYYSEHVPSDVKNAWENSITRPYMKSSGSAYLSGIGLRNEFYSDSIVFSKNLPSEKCNPRIALTDSQATKYVKLENEISDLQKAYDDLRTKIYNALITLKTFKRVAEAFPEAAKFLPESPVYQVPAIQLDNIRAALNSTENKK